MFAVTPSRSTGSDGRVDNDGGDTLPEPFVWYPDDDGIGDRRVQLQSAGDLLRVHLLSAGVDTRGTAPEQGQCAVVLQAGEVAGDRPALAVSVDRERRRDFSSSFQ